jgi:hypothetical protein
MKYIARLEMWSAIGNDNDNNNVDHKTETVIFQNNYDEWQYCFPYLAVLSKIITSQYGISSAMMTTDAWI